MIAAAGAAVFMLASAPAVNAAGSVSFTSPADGSTVSAGTSVTPTGVVSATGTTGGLDLVLVLDSSGSMGGRETAAGVTKSVREWQQDAAIGIVNSLPNGAARVAVVDFDSNAFVVRPLTLLNSTASRNAVIAAINGIDASGGTDIRDGIEAATAHLIAQGAAGASKQMVVFSDGGSDQTAATNAALAAVAAGQTVHSVALPGASLGVLQAVASNGNGVFVDFSNPANLANIGSAFSTGAGGTPVGITKVVVTLPDGTVIDPQPVNSLGSFTVAQPFNVTSGANTWTVMSFFTDGSTATDTLTLNVPTTGGGGGGGGGTAPIPLPAGMPLLLGGLVLLGAAGARRRKG